MPAPLSTPRLLLRPFRPDDARDVQRLAGNPAVADTTSTIPHPYLDGMAEAWISETASETTSQTWAITLAERLAGCISLMNIDSTEAELGYWVARELWGEGIATEAGQAVVQHARDHLGLLHLHASHYERNPASGAVIAKLGFTRTGTRQVLVKRAQTLETFIDYRLQLSIDAPLA